VYNERAEHHPVVDAARRLISDADTFVQQTTVSHVNFLLEGFTLAARAQGNALVSVALGAATDPTSTEAFLAAGVLSESRVFPSFRFDPEHGDVWADWMHVGENEFPEATWVGRDVIWGNDDAAPGHLQLTPADVLFLDGRFGDQFHLLDPSVEHTDLVDVAEWSGLDSSGKALGIPFLWLSTPEGAMARCVVSPMVTRAVTQSAARWSVLQEWSGVKSSLVQQRLDAERDALIAEKDAAIEAAEADFNQRMTTSTEVLARQIVENIADSLLDGSGASVLTDPGARTQLAVQAAAVKPAPEEAAVSESTSEDPEPEPEPEVPALSLDEAYIDTPLCTSCNECTDRNGQIFAYDENKQAYIKDAAAGPFRDIVMAAEKCPVRIIHPGKPSDPDEADLDEWIERAQPYQ